jgi:hypothetical protein
MLLPMLTVIVEDLRILRIQLFTNALLFLHRNVTCNREE